MATVTLANLNKQWGTFTGVSDLSLDIADGEFLVLLGSSGCGKTTTMRMIAGLEEPTSGDIRIDGRLVNGVHPRDRDLAMVFQNYGLYPHMSVAENIAYPLKIRGVGRAERTKMVQQAAERVELNALLDRKPSALSGGQRQRVALARALVRTPKLFLMDEPLSNLDAKLRTVMRAQLKHLQKELATTTIYVTHDQVEAMTLADRIAIMQGGKLQQEGTPATIYSKPANTFVAGFIGSPPMNLIEGEIADNRFSHPNGHVALSFPPASGKVILGQRPEDIALCAHDASELRGIVYASELLGDCTMVCVQLGSALVNVRVAPEEGRRIGEPVGIRLNPDKLHFFDAKTTQRIGA
ncbi:ABC transporter ATP-binding protein [Kaistia sp. 32K]|uniref:ABC transporter ATP-binding protein n=1 Tax=Kaistia sp. 32K TaxID=2795690 RepID=UPI001916A82D|nr:ABC transporter ATP-binding protein [Kaistia sp. 32K]BCP53964.1 ABC transporter ATP-binding protein [Kaistia sp. 32K]